MPTTYYKGNSSRLYVRSAPSVEQIKPTRADIEAAAEERRARVARPEIGFQRRRLPGESQWRIGKI